MKKRTIRTLLLSLAFCLATSVFAGTAMLQVNAATADVLSADNFKVLGASIRLKGENDATGDGIRFAIGVEKSIYEANADIKNNVRVLMMPTQLVTGDLEIGERYQPEGSEAYADAEDEKASSVWTLKTVNVDGQSAEYYCTFAYLWNIPDNFYNVNVFVFINDKLNIIKTNDTDTKTEFFAVFYNSLFCFFRNRENRINAY